MRFCVLKRDFRLFLRCLLPAAALTMVFTVVCVAAAFVGVKGAGSAYTPVKAAVVNGEDSLVSRLAVNTIAGTDYISPLMDVSVCDFDEAMEGLRAGELAAVIVLPEGTVDGILSGKDTRGTIWLSPAAAAHADVVASMASFGELLLAAGQYGIFSGQQLIWSHGLDARFQEMFLKEYNTRLLGEALNAQNRYFDLRITDYADTNLSAEGWYAACWLALLLLLTAMFFSRLYTADLKKPILCRLRGLGVTDGAFLAGKVLLPLGFQLLLLVAALIAAGKLTGLSVRVGSLLAGIGGVLLAVIIGGFTVMAFDHGIPILAAVSLGGLLLCGGILPRQVLPEAVRTLGSVTPFGAVLGFLTPVFGGKLSLLPCLAAPVYAVVLTVLVFCRLRRVRTGGAVV